MWLVTGASLQKTTGSTYFTDYPTGVRAGFMRKRRIVRR